MREGLAVAKIGCCVCEREFSLCWYIGVHTYKDFIFGLTTVEELLLCIPGR